MRFLYWTYRFVRRLAMWGQRRFTPLGGLLLITMMAMLVVAPDIEHSLGYQAILLLAGFSVVGLLLAPWGRPRFRFERQLPRFGTVNETFGYRVRVRNLTKQRQDGLGYLEEIHDPMPTYPEFVQRMRPGRRNRSFQMSAPLPGFHRARPTVEPLPTLPPEGEVEIHPRFVPLRRGPLHFSGACLTQPEPLGLVRGLRRQRRAETVLILPKRYPISPVALPGHTQYQRGGVAFASGVGESEEFVALREYRRGDSLRRIHWRSTARIGEPIVKEYQDEFFVRYALVLDTFCDPSMDPVFEEAVSVAASFACTVPDQESLLDLLFLGPAQVCVTAGRGVGHSEQMLEALAGAQPCRDPGFDRLRRLVLGHCRTLSGCILVLVGLDEDRRRLIRELKSVGLPLLVLLLVFPGEAEALDRGKAEEQPDRLMVLELGRVGEGLREL